MEELLNSINEKLEKLENYGFNTNEFQTKYNDLRDVYEGKYQERNYNSPTITKYAGQNIEQLIKNFNSNIDFILRKTTIFDYIEKVKSHLNKDITTRKLDQIILGVSNHISAYNSLVIEGYSSSREKEIIDFLYTLIKYEYRLNYNSKLLNRFLGMHFGQETLIELINEDVNNMIHNPDVFKRYNEELAIDNVDEIMVSLLAFNENDYKNEVLKELIKTKEEIDSTLARYDKLESIKKLPSRNEEKCRSEISRTVGNIRRNILPKILSLIVLIGISAGVKKESDDSRLYKTSFICYDTVNGEYNEMDYDNLTMDDVKVEIYYPADESSNRTKETFIVKNDGKTIEEYASSHYTASDLVSIETLSSDKFESQKDEKIIKVLIPDGISSNDTKSKIDGFDIFALYAGYILIDMLISLAIYSTLRQRRTGNDYSERFESQGCLFSAIISFKDFINEIRIELDDLKGAIEGSKIKSNGETYDPKEKANCIKEYNKLEKIYSELLKKYNYLETLIKYNDLDSESVLKRRLP